MVINVNIKTILELKMFQLDYFLQLMKNLLLKLVYRKMVANLNAIFNSFQEQMLNKMDLSIIKMF